MAPPSSSGSRPRPPAAGQQTSTVSRNSVWAPPLVVQPSGIVARPLTPEHAWDPMDLVPDADTYVAVPSSKAARKRLLEEKEALEASGKRARLDKRYVLVNLPPLRAPFYYELSPEQRVVDYRLYRQPNIPVVERLVLERLTLHRPQRRHVHFNDEGHGYDFPDPVRVLGRWNLPLDGFKLAEKPDDPALQNRVVGWTEHEECLVLSPNTSYIPYVPPPDMTNYRLRMRSDGQFGAEDWTLVPTYYMPSHAPHIACIPRCPPAPGHPWHLMWLGVDMWFESVLDNYKPHAEKVVLSRVVFKELKKLVNPLRKLATDYLADCKRKKTDPFPWARGLEMTLSHLMGRLGALPVSRRRAVLMARECQRLWRELFGMMNFVHLVQPVLSGLVDAPEVKTPHWFIGAVTEDLHHVQLLYAAGVPVWHVRNYDIEFHQLLRTRNRIAVPYAEEMQSMYTPAQMACINRHPDNLPFIFEGSPKDPRRVKHLHRYATLRVAVSRPIDDPSDDKDPLAFVDFERGASRARPLTNIPGFIAEVGKGGPPRTRGEQQHDLPPFDFDTANVPEQVEAPSEQLPDFLYAGSNFEDYELIDSPVFRPVGFTDDEIPPLAQFSTTTSTGPSTSSSTTTAASSSATTAASSSATTAVSSSATIASSSATTTVSSSAAASSSSSVPSSAIPGSAAASTSPASGSPTTTTEAVDGPSSAPSGPAVELITPTIPGQSRWGRSTSALPNSKRRVRKTTPPPRARHPALDLPSMPSSWYNEIKDVRPYWPFESSKTDDHRSFPLPSIITGPDSDERCAFYVQAWTTLAPYLVEGAQSDVRELDMPMVVAPEQVPNPEEKEWRPSSESLRCRTALKASDWKQLLFARVTMRGQGAVAGTMGIIRDLLGEGFDWDAFVKDQLQPYTIRGVVVQPGVLPPPDVMKDELLYVQELGFRQDVLDLERRVRPYALTPAEELHRLRHMFDKRTWDGVDIFNLRDLGEGRGLAAANWLERSRYVQAFARVMMHWIPRLPASLDHLARAERMTYGQFYWFEEEVVAFYVRLLWHELHRTAIAPPRRSTA
ncbi:hypothetical protein FB107DRAFT_275841 [Schizophyllum commune]